MYVQIARCRSGSVVKHSCFFENKSNSRVLTLWEIFSTDGRLSILSQNDNICSKGGIDMNQYVTGATIKRLRENRKMTQAKMAEILNVSDKAVSKWETGV